MFCLKLISAALFSLITFAGLGGDSYTLAQIFTLNEAVHVQGQGVAIRTSAPIPSLNIQGTDSREADILSSAAIEDVSDFWRETTARTSLFAQPNIYPSTYLSFDSRDPYNSGKACNQRLFLNVNAMYCPRLNMMMWDRGSLIPTLREKFGDVSVLVVFSHEFGHLIQAASGMPFLENRFEKEQQADCYSGAYVKWVSNGKSSRFVVTQEGVAEVNKLMKDVEDSPGTPVSTERHGSAAERVSAFNKGFMNGEKYCRTSL